MLDGVRGPIAELAQSLRRARSGEGTNAEVVRWLGSVNGIASAIPVPPLRDAHRTYARTLLHKSELFEILVLHWRSGCVSSIHDHGGAHCWFAVSNGTMGIENYLRYDAGTSAGHARIRLEGRELLGAGAIDYRQDDVHLHRCVAGDGGVTTLHVYAHPIERFHAFDEAAQTCVEVSPTYDAVL